MIVYELLCPDRHRSTTTLASMFDDNPACPTCGQRTSRVPANPRMSGMASAGPSRDQMPRSWRGVQGGHPDVVAGWRQEISKREKLEERYPELAGDRRPVLAHEGIFRERPLRAGDDIPTSVREAVAHAATPAASSTPTASSTSRTPSKESSG